MARTSIPKKTTASTSKTQTGSQKSSTASSKKSILSADKNDFELADLPESVVYESPQSDAVTCEIPLENEDKPNGTIDVAVTISSDGVQSEHTVFKPNLLSISQIVLPLSQPRRYFDKDKMDSLTESVRSEGILQPILVRPLPDGNYELVAGERRLKAAKNVGLTSILVNVLAISDSEATQYALTENLLREDLNALDEAEAILQLLTLRLSCSLDKVTALLYKMDNASKNKITRNVLGSKDAFVVFEVFNELGKINWQSFIRTRLPLLDLQEDVLFVLRAGKIEYTKALEIAKVKSDDDRAELLANAIEYDMSLKEIRAEVKKYNPAPQKAQLQTRMENTYNNFKKSKAWDNPELRDKLEPILSQLEAILGC
jgi:ParB family transcriptional regulator, chromosome partitioning protein